MLPFLFAHPLILSSAFIAGILIGFLLQKGRISQFKTIVGQLLLKDFTLAKMLLTAIIVGSFFTHWMLSIGLPIEYPVIPWSIFATIIGSILIGIGLAILGYCPGTCAAAAGQGSNDAWWGLLGMFCGAAFYSEIHAVLKKPIHSVWLITTNTIPKALGLSPWLLLALLAIFAIVFFRFIERRKRAL